MPNQDPTQNTVNVPQEPLQVGQNPPPQTPVEPVQEIPEQNQTPIPSTPIQTDLPPLPDYMIQNDDKGEENKNNSEESGTNAPNDLPPMITTPKKKYGGGKIIATILGIFLLVGGVGTGVYLVRQQQTAESQAYMTGGGTSRDQASDFGTGTKSSTKGSTGGSGGGSGSTGGNTGSTGSGWSGMPGVSSTSDDDSDHSSSGGPSSPVVVPIPGQQSTTPTSGGTPTASCPSGLSGTAVCPTKPNYNPDNPNPGVNSGYQTEGDAMYGCGAGSYHTGSNGNFYCGDSSGDGGGGTSTNTVIDNGVSCQNVKVFKGESATALTASELTTLKAGDAISFCAFPIDSTAKKVIFTINGVAQSAVTPQDACMSARGSCFCMSYTIPESTKTFNIGASLYSQ